MKITLNSSQKIQLMSELTKDELVKVFKSVDSQYDDWTITHSLTEEFIKRSLEIMKHAEFDQNDQKAFPNVFKLKLFNLSKEDITNLISILKKLQ